MTYVIGIFLTVLDGAHEQAGYNGGVNVFNELGKLMIAVCVPFYE